MQLFSPPKKHFIHIDERAITSARLFTIKSVSHTQNINKIEILEFSIEKHMYDMISTDPTFHRKIVLICWMISIV